MITKTKHKALLINFLSWENVRYNLFLDNSASIWQIMRILIENFTPIYLRPIPSQQLTKIIKEQLFLA